MADSDASHVLRTIEDAFRGCQAPTSRKFFRTEFSEHNEYLYHLRRGPWHTIDILALRDYSASLELATPDGLRYLLPAYLRAMVLNRDELDTGFDAVLHWFRKRVAEVDGQPGTAVGRLGDLTGHQLDAVIGCFEYVAARERYVALSALASMLLELQRRTIADDGS